MFCLACYVTCLLDVSTNVFEKGLDLWLSLFYLVHETANSLRNGIWRKVNLGPGAMITHVGSGISSLTPFVVGVVFL